jgi:hypothetical protein
MSGFSCSFVVTITHYAYPNFLSKGINVLECKYQITPATHLVFVDASEDSIMADDVTTPSNLLICINRKGKS